MPQHVFNLVAVLQHLPEGLSLGEALFFHEISCLNSNRYGLKHNLELGAQALLKTTRPVELHRRRWKGQADVRFFRLQLDPPPRTPAWVQPIEFVLPHVCWTHGEARIAFFPALGVEVLADSPEELERLLPKHIRSALLRTKALRLDHLIWLQRCQTLQVESLELPLKLPSPKQTAMEAEESQSEKEPIIKQVGLDLLHEPLAEAFEINDLVARLAETLTQRQPRSILLIGPPGVGKTAAIHQLVQKREQFHLGRTPFWATSGARLVAGMCGFGMWQQRCQTLIREASKEKAILHLGNLVELLEVGKSEHRSQGVGTFLRPYLARGELLALAECTPEQIAVIERQDPQLLQCFATFRIEEPDRAQGQAILSSQAIALALQRPQRTAMPIEPDALNTLDTLHRRYATYSAYPGRPLRFLRNLFTDLGENRPISQRDVTRSFARETGLPLFLLEDSVRLDLDATQRWFGQRVIGQGDAVSLVVNLLATVKARLGRPGRPIASLLFIGPTGVGKTEMAKALAEFLFGSKLRLTRFDMSEFADPMAVQRLIGGFGQAEGLLTARVREQPFSVILLDEFEKAHPALFDLLLQVLGEGRLTDASGRLADFRNSVVIMTSNLGAATFQQGVFGFSEAAGQVDMTAVERERQRAREHFESAVQAFVRPEFFNRIDRIVAFAPLDQDTILHIARRQLLLLQQRDGVRYRGVHLETTDEVALHLARKGYDVRYGARPLKRALERELLAPLAEQMNGYTADTPLRAAVSIAGETVTVHVRARTDESGRQLTSLGRQPQAVELAGACVDARRDVQALQRCSDYLELLNEVFSLERLAKRIRKKNRLQMGEDTTALAELPQLRQLRGECDNLWEASGLLEDELLRDLYGQEQTITGYRPRLEQTCQRLAALLRVLYLRRFDNPDNVTIVVYSEERDRMQALAHAYYLTAKSSCRIDVWQILPPPPTKKHDKPRTASRRLLIDPLDAFRTRGVLMVRWWDAEERDWSGEARAEDPWEGVVGLALRIRGPAAYPLFVMEEGLHLFNSTRTPGRCLVQTSDLPMFHETEGKFYMPPSGVERRGFITSQSMKRRQYGLDTSELHDFVLNRKFTWSGDNWQPLLAQLLELRLETAARSLLAS
jgi:ATP-dependent Clp protease ATP-binding subunit ClpC